MTIPTNIEPDLESLFAIFPSEEYMADFEEVAAEEVPQPYHKLLVHEHHMTVTVEAHHHSFVDVKVLQEHITDEDYARKILLACETTGQIVQFGVMRVRFRYLPTRVRKEILSRKTPLGRILIRNRVLRRIEPTAYIRVTPGPGMVEWFELDYPQPTYGRLAMIHCNERPAVELIEIVAPE